MQTVRLEGKLGYSFGDRSVLIQALTHTSYGHENNQSQSLAFRDNERLEFLGDAVLDLVITDLLLESFPNAPEGRLSKMRAAIVNEKTLADIALSLGLNECVLLGKGEERTGGNQKPSILSCTFEALIAAIYLDGGIASVFSVVRNLFESFLECESDFVLCRDHKTQYQEFVQAKKKSTPTYHLHRSFGPDHAKTFEVEVKVNGKVTGRATGSSKKEAEQNAARVALEGAPI